MGIVSLILAWGLVSGHYAVAQESGDVSFSEDGHFADDSAFDPVETTAYQSALAALASYCAEHPPTIEAVPYNTLLVDGVLSPGAGLAAGHIALTFDDGPSPTVSNTIRRTLEVCGLRATFFYTGERVRWMETRHPEEAVVRATLAGGHSVGSHSMTHHEHLNIGTLASRDRDADRREIDFEVRQAHAVITTAAGQWTPFFRFPYGAGWRVPEALAYLATLGLTNFHWNMTTGDADARHRRNGAQVLQYATDQMMNGGHFDRHTGCYQGGTLRGGILLAHEKHSTTSVLPRLLKWMMEEGATFVVFTHD